MFDDNLTNAQADLLAEIEADELDTFGQTQRVQTYKAVTPNTLSSTREASMAAHPAGKGRANVKHPAPCGKVYPFQMCYCPATPEPKVNMVKDPAKVASADYAKRRAETLAIMGPRVELNKYPPNYRNREGISPAPLLMVPPRLR